MAEPTPEMVERVALAICEADCSRVTPNELDRCRDLARAAIVAMREPTEAMVQAGRWPAEDDGPAACWLAMIDAALAPEPPHAD